MVRTRLCFSKPWKLIGYLPVALSRARHGLYILGNAQNLASRSRMWASVLEELESVDAVGEGFPVACHRHPDTVEHISKPGQLARIAPDGMSEPHICRLKG